MAVASKVPTITAKQRADEITEPSRSLWKDAFRRLRANKMAVVSIFVIIAFALMAILPVVLPLHDPIKYMSRPTDPGGGGTRLPPMWMEGGNPKFPLGTDASGRDVLSRIMYGSQVSLLVGIIPALIVVVIGAAVGLASGFLGGTADNLLMRFTDIIYAFPDILFVIIMISALRGTAIAEVGDGLLVIFISLSVIGWVGVARLVRGQVMALRQQAFVEAAQALGSSSFRIMIKHLLPNSMGPIIVVATFLIPGFIILESILSFIGLGIRPPKPTWGEMVQDGYANINSAAHLVWIPAACIALLTLAFTFLGDGLRDALDPRSTHSTR